MVSGVSKDRGAIICNYSSWTSQSLKAKVLLFFETSGTIYPTTQRHIIKDLSPAPHRCENLVWHFKDTPSYNSSPWTLLLGRKRIAVRAGADFSQSIVLPRDGFKGWLCSAIMLCYWRNSPQWARATSFTRFLDQTQRRTTVGRTPLDEWSARRRDLYLTTHNTHNRQTPMPPVGFEPTISANERPETYALDRAATETGMFRRADHKYSSIHLPSIKC